jgi:hypothetical protein
VGSRSIKGGKRGLIRGGLATVNKVPGKAVVDKSLNMLRKDGYLNRGAAGRSKNVKRAIRPTCEPNRAL